MFSKKVRIILVPFLLIAVWIFFHSHDKPEIITVINGLVFVKNPPDSVEEKISWWNDNQEILKDKYHLVPEHDYFTIPVMNFGRGYEQLPETDFISGGSPDDYVCDDKITTKERCIKKDTSFMIMGDVSKSLFLSIDGKLYKQDPQDKNNFLSP